MSARLPVGTVTFFFTDIEGSTALAQRFGTDYPQLLANHFSIVRDGVSSGGGVEVKTTGDGVFAVFAGVAGALRAAAAIQHGMDSRAWPDGGDVRVRIGIHSGEATIAENDYVGVEVHRAARIMAAGHGGQILVSQAARLLAREGFEFRSLGEHLLRGLESDESVYQMIVAGLPSDFPPLRTASAARNNLPIRSTSIIGRDEDISNVSELIGEHRLVTILGPGGVGKTSLAVTAGSHVVGEFPGGVVFVDLSGVTDPAFVVASLANELGAEPKTVDGVARMLADAPALLLLDNFEQVVEAAEDIRGLMDANAQVRFLVTSQVPLRVPGEHRYLLGTLGVNGSGDASGVELFKQRALAVDPSFSAEHEAVSALVNRLDGLPLAIELVAARANVLSPAEMLERLDQGALTYSAPVGSPDRHRSLDDALQWSYDLLDETSRLAFGRLAVFAGGMSLAAAESVVGDNLVPDPISPIGELVDRSLLLRATRSSSRYHMLDGIRRFGRHLLSESGEGPQIQDRFASYYGEMGRDAYEGLQSDRGEWWRAHLDDELDNLREVLSILHVGGKAAEGLELLGDTWRFYHSRGYLLEFDIWLERFFGLPSAEADSTGLVKGLMARAAVRYWQQKKEAAVTDYEEAVARARDLDDQSIMADALYGLATSLIIAGREGEADQLLVDTKALYAELGNAGGLADVLAAETFSVLNREGLIGLGPRFEEASDLYIQAGRRTQATQGIYGQTAVAIAEDRLDDARALARSALAVGVELNDLFLQTWGLEYVASVELESGNVEQAALFVGAAEASWARIGGGWGPGIVGLDEPRHLLEERLGQEKAQELIERGLSLDVAAAIELALDQT